MPRALLLDLDDTLYPYEPCDAAGRDAIRSEAADRDLGIDDVDAFYERGRRTVKSDIAGLGSAHSRVLYLKRAMERHGGRTRAGDAVALADAYWDAYLDEMELFPDVRDTLDTLADLPVAIVTDLTARIQLRKLDRLDIDAIDHVVTSEEVGRDKPAAAMFAVALARLDAAPSDAVMVGDDPAADIAGANRAGIETVLFNGTYDPGEHPSDAEPDHTIDAFADITGVVR